MRRSLAKDVLHEYDESERFVFNRTELYNVFREDTPEAFAFGITKLIDAGTLSRACRNVYVNHSALSIDYTYMIEHVASALRRGFHNYISLESALYEYGVISQEPIALTVMTTGRRGVFSTIYGVIEFTHTYRDRLKLMRGSKLVKGRPLRVAYRHIALRDLKRVGRNIDMVNLGETQDDY